MSRLQVEIAKAQAGMKSADQWAAGAERLLAQVRAELQAERDRHHGPALTSSCASALTLVCASPLTRRLRLR